jgi:hypothetical protein
MRFLSLVLVMGMVGCASQPAKEGAPSSAAAQREASVANEKAPPAASEKTATTTQLPKKVGYRVVTKDGKQMYCSKDTATGSRITTVEECLTPEQLERRAESARESVEGVRRGSSIPQPGS